MAWLIPSEEIYGMEIMYLNIYALYLKAVTSMAWDQPQSLLAVGWALVMEAKDWKPPDMPALSLSH